MKRHPALRSIGLFFLIASILGLFLSILLIVGIWTIKSEVNRTLGELLTISLNTLSTTKDAINVMRSTIENTEADLIIIQTSLSNLSLTLDSISPSLVATGDLFGDNLTQTVNETQSTLYSASTSAKLIDDTLSLIAKIPLLGANYQPDVPLNISLQQTAESLSSMPGTFETIETSLDSTASSLSTVKTDILTLSDNINLFYGNLEDAKEVLNNYETAIIQLEEKLQKTKNNLPNQLTILAIFLSGIFVVLGITQLSLFAQGIEYLNGDIQVLRLSDINRPKPKNGS